MSESNYEAGEFSAGHGDHGGVALPDAPRSAKTVRSGRPAPRRNDVPNLTIALLPNRTVPFIAKLSAALLFAALGGFLVSEIPHTPALFANMAVLAVLSFLGSIALVYVAVREALGRLVLDDQKIAFRPGWFGRDVAWADVSSWRMNDDPVPPGVDRQLMFWVGRETFPVLFDISRLNNEALSDLRCVLEKRLGDES
jgi:hypothetical protein